MVDETAYPRVIRLIMMIASLILNLALS